MRQQLRILTCLAALGLSAPAQAQEQMTLQKPSIERFINYVWESSPAIAESEARVTAADAAQRTASKWQYNPEIEFEVENVDGEDKTKTLGISQTIDWSGKFLSSGKTALFELQAVEADRDEIRQNTALEVLSSLADYRAAKDIYNLAVERSGLMERFATLAQKGFKAGDIDQSEKNLAQLALSEALVVQADVKTVLAETKQALDSSIGFPLENGFALPELPEALPALPEAIDENQILMALPSLRAMRSREDAAKAVITGARKDRLPDPTIGITGGQDAGADMIGFSVSVPLNIFNTYGAEVDQAKAEALAEAKAGQNAFYSARTRLKSAQRSYQLSRKAWGNWQENGAQALAEQTDILDRKFKVGDLSATDYLVQIEQALDTQVAAEELHAKVWKSWFAWLGASGTINQWIQNSGE
ncbi:MAG: TolC family protein [Planctomycetaceae bacterium]|nr:TolC family protein [Planctomycetaceae bacterium]